jgi:hypothetical protein
MEILCVYCEVGTKIEIVLQFQASDNENWNN